MLVIVGPSASGKTEISRCLIKEYNLKRVITCTTRPMRRDEVNGRDYYFLSVEEFKEGIKNNLFIEYTKYNNDYYGTYYKEIADDKIIILDRVGFLNIKKILKDKIISFYIETPLSERKMRMIKRGDTINRIYQKIEYDNQNFPSKISGIDYYITNDTDSILESAKKIYDLYKERLGL
ncbi:MAG TPA: guanylate kinase [Acholeplasma sp.]|nr:guanylate kinase [Acholeplasma sp.]